MSSTNGRGKPRDDYAIAGRAGRYALHRAATARADDTDQPALRPVDWRVLAAVLAYTSSYSRLADHVTLARLAAFAGLGDNAESARRAGKSMKLLASLGIVAYQPGRNQRASKVALPAPPADWPDPTVQASTVVDPRHGGGSATTCTLDDPDPTTVEASVPTTVVDSLQPSEEYPEKSSSSSGADNVGPPGEHLDDDEARIIEEACEIVARLKLARRPRHLEVVEHQDRWLREVAGDVRPKAVALLDAAPSLTALQLAERIEPSSAPEAIVKDPVEEACDLARRRLRLLEPYPRDELEAELDTEFSGNAEAVAAGLAVFDEARGGSSWSERADLA